MKRKFGKYLPYIVIDLVAGLVGGCLVLILVLPEESATLAAWFSAIGTISAVVLSLFLVTRKPKISLELYPISIGGDISDGEGRVLFRTDYKLASYIHAINPDDKGYVLTLKSSEILVNNTVVEDVEVPILESKGVGNEAKKYLIASGTDSVLFVVDWNPIYQNFYQDCDTDPWRLLKGTFDDRVSVQIHMQTNTGAIVKVKVLAPKKAIPIDLPTT